MLCHVLRDATPMFQMLRTNQAISASSCGESPIEHASRKRAATQATGTTPRTHQCPGMTTIEMQACAAEQRNQSLKALKQKLPTPDLAQWEAITSKVCKQAFTPSKNGAIYSQLVVVCTDQFNRSSLDQFTPLGDSSLTPP